MICFGLSFALIYGLGGIGVMGMGCVADDDDDDDCTDDVVGAKKTAILK